jgi:hypothetical protein
MHPIGSGSTVVQAFACLLAPALAGSPGAATSRQGGRARGERRGRRAPRRTGRAHVGAAGRNHRASAAQVQAGSPRGESRRRSRCWARPFSRRRRHSSRQSCLESGTSSSESGSAHERADRRRSHPIDARRSALATLRRSAVSPRIHLCSRDTRPFRTGHTIDGPAAPVKPPAAVQRAVPYSYGRGRTRRTQPAPSERPRATRFAGTSHSPPARYGPATQLSRAVGTA